MHWLLNAANLVPIAWRKTDTRALRRGAFARVAVAFKDRAKSTSNELLWLEVTQVGETSLWGKVASTPKMGFLHHLAEGQAIQFERRNIWDTAPADTVIAIRDRPVRPRENLLRYGPRWA